MKLRNKTTKELTDAENNGLYTITDVCGEEKKKWRK